VKRVKCYLLYNDRIVLVEMQTDGNNLIILQIYMPTSGYKDEEVKQVYQQL
jgi:hypothetical protein